MTPDELRAALANAGLSQREFARYVNVAHQTVHRWVQGDRPVPGWVPVLFENMNALGSRVRQSTASDTSGSILTAEVETQARTWIATTCLRYNLDVLEQMFQCQRTGETRWQPIPRIEWPL